MKIDFNDQGEVSTVTVTSTVFEFRQHNRAIDVALFLVPFKEQVNSGIELLKAKDQEIAGEMNQWDQLAY